jgi:hypothetical protein
VLEPERGRRAPVPAPGQVQREKKTSATRERGKRERPWARDRAGSETRGNKIKGGLSAWLQGPTSGKVCSSTDPSAGAPNQGHKSWRDQEHNENRPGAELLRDQILAPEPKIGALCLQKNERLTRRRKRRPDRRNSGELEENRHRGEN